MEEMGPSCSNLGTIVEHSQILMRFKEKIFHCKDSQAAKHPAQGCCTVSLVSGRIFKSQLYKPWSLPCFMQGFEPETSWPFPPELLWDPDYQPLHPAKYNGCSAQLTTPQSSPKTATTWTTNPKKKCASLQAPGSLQYYNLFKKQTLECWPQCVQQSYSSSGPWRSWNNGFNSEMFPTCVILSLKPPALRLSVLLRVS